MQDESDISTSIPESLRLYSVQQVARILQLRDAAVRKLVHRGKLTASRIGPFLRIPQTSLERFLEESACKEQGGLTPQKRGQS